MNRCSVGSRRTLALLAAVVVLLAGLPGLAAAAPVQGVGGTITVDEGETVDGVQAAGGTVVIHGTVTGDVQVAAGTLVITGTVEGDVEGAAGTVDIQGRVGGDVELGAGSLTLGPDAVIDGRLQAGVGSARLAGTVRGDAAVGTGSLVLEPTATFEGDLRYDGELTDRGATVGGSLIHDPSLGAGEWRLLDGVGDAVLDVYGFVVSFVLGAVLLLVFPAGTDGVRSRILGDPLTSGLYGLVALVGVPILLVFVALTIIGIPLAVVGALLFALAAWVASVLGRYAVGSWLLGYVGTENRWAALFVGLLAVALVGLVPFLGTLVEFVVLLLGLGALGAVGLAAFRGRRAERAA